MRKRRKRGERGWQREGGEGRRRRGEEEEAWCSQVAHPEQPGAVPRRYGTVRLTQPKRNTRVRASSSLPAKDALVASPEPPEAADAGRLIGGPPRERRRWRRWWQRGRGEKKKEWGPRRFFRRANWCVRYCLGSVHNNKCCRGGSVLIRRGPRY